MKLVIDIETTHLNPYEGDILQVCAYNMDTKKYTTRTYYSDFSSEAKAGALAINGLTDEVIAELRRADNKSYPIRFSDDLKFWQELFDQASGVIGHTVEFDIRWLKHYGLVLDNQEAICTKKLMHAHQKTKTGWSLRKCTEHFFPEVYNPDLAHKAEYDVELCFKLYEKLITI